MKQFNDSALEAMQQRDRAQAQAITSWVEKNWQNMFPDPAHPRGLTPLQQNSK